MGLLDNTTLSSPSGLPSQATIQEAVQLWQPDPAEFTLSRYFGTDSTDAQVAEWDEVDSIIGMAQDHVPGTATKTIEQRGVTTRMEKSFYIEESGNIPGRSFERVRHTSDPLRNGGEELVMRLSEQLTIRRETRKEWMRAQALSQGSITFNGRVVTYGVPVGNKPTAGVTWDTIANATPATDIMTWSLLFRGIGGEINCLFNRKVAHMLAQNAEMRDLFKQSGFAGQLGPQNVTTLLGHLTAESDVPMTFEVYDKGYKRESDGVYVPFLADDRFVMVAAPPRNQTLGTWTSTGSIANAPEGSFNPAPGPYVIVDNRLRKREKHYEQTQGENGMICFKHPANVIQATIA